MICSVSVQLLSEFCRGFLLAKLYLCRQSCWKQLVYGRAFAKPATEENWARALSEGPERAEPWQSRFGEIQSRFDDGHRQIALYRKCVVCLKRISGLYYGK